MGVPPVYLLLLANSLFRRAIAAVRAENGAAVPEAFSTERVEERDRPRPTRRLTLEKGWVSHEGWVAAAAVDHGSSSSIRILHQSCSTSKSRRKKRGRMRSSIRIQQQQQQPQPNNEERGADYESNRTKQWDKLNMRGVTRSYNQTPAECGFQILGAQANTPFAVHKPPPKLPIRQRKQNERD